MHTQDCKAGLMCELCGAVGRAVHERAGKLHSLAVWTEAPVQVWRMHFQLWATIIT